MKQRLALIALLTLAATACGALAQHGTLYPAPIPSQASATTADTPAPPTDLLSQGYERTKQDFVKVGEIATAAHEAVGMQCSSDAAAFFNITDHIADSTGFFFADIEMERVAQSSNIFAAWRKFADSCSPLLFGPEKFGALVKLPRNIAKLLNGGKP